MFGRRAGMGTKIVASLVAALVVASTMTGCKCKPDTPVETVEQQAARLIEEATVAFEAGELDKAEQKVNEAKTTFSGVEGAQELLDKIAAARKIEMEKKRIAGILKEAEALLAAKKWDDAIAKANEAGDHPDVKRIIRDANIGKKSRLTVDADATYNAQSAKVDAAIGAGRFSDAIKEIRTLEGSVGAGRPSRMREIPRIESNDLLAQAKRERNLKRSIALAERAVAKDRTNTAASTFLRAQKAKESKTGTIARDTREYNDKLRRAKGLLTRDPRSVVRMCDDLRRLARKIGRSTGEVDSLARKAREQSEYQTAFDQAKRFLQRNQLDEAERAAKKARSIIYKREVVDLLKTIVGKKAVIEGDAAMLAREWEKAVTAYSRAKANDVDVGAKLASAEAKRDEAKLGVRIASIRAAVKAGRYLPIRAEAEALGKKYPDNKELQKIIEDGASKAEIKTAEAGARKFYDAAAKRAKAIKPPTAYTRIIEVWESAMGDLVGTYEKKAKKAISSAKDKLFAGRYKQVTKRKYKPGQDAQKIKDFEAALPQFKGTSYEKKLKGLISKAKTAKASAIYKKESVKIKAARTIDAEIMAIQSAQLIGDFKGTSFEKKLAGLLTSAKTTKAGAAYKKLMVGIKACKTDIQKINRYDQALTNPDFKGTKYEGTIKKSVTKVRDGKAKVPFGKFIKSIAKKKPQERIAALTAALGEPTYSGTSFLEKMTADIKKTKEGLLKSKFKKLTGDVKKMRTPQLRIAALEGARPAYAGTKFDDTIKGMIQKENDGILAARYKKLLVVIKTMKPLPKIERLKAALAEFASSKKYKALVEKLLKKEQDGLEKNIYGAIQKEVKGAKKAVDQVRILERRKGDLKSDTYTEKIAAQIKKLNDGIAKAAQARKDKALKASYDKLMKKIGVKGMKSAQKVTILETEKAAFAGSSYAKKIVDQIAKSKKAIAGEVLKAADAKAKKVFDAIKLVKAKKPADCDANIAKLEDAKFRVGKSSYAEKIDSLIAKERKTKAKLMPKKPK